MAKLVCFFVFLMLAAASASRDFYNDCTDLRSRLHQCDRDSPSRECCRDAKEYVERQRCQPRSLGVELLQNCPREDFLYTEQCSDLRSRLQHCNRESPSSYCCRDAQEYVERRGCRPESLGAELLRRCREQDDCDQCSELRSRLQQCDRQSPSQQCCRDAEEYVERRSCRPQSLGAELLRHCRDQEEESSYYSLQDQCSALRSRLRQCDRDAPSRQCCTDAQEYVENQRCRPRSPGAEVLRHCREQHKDSYNPRDQCSDLRSRLNRCDRDSPSRQCCSDAEEYVETHHCRPQALGAEMLQHCRGDSDETYVEIGEFITGAWL